MWISKKLYFNSKNTDVFSVCGKVEINGKLETNKWGINCSLGQAKVHFILLIMSSQINHGMGPWFEDLLCR